jgi:3-oxoacyl-[acyl-carrier protein] reductase
MLYGKTCMITGASRGIGKSTAELFASQGADLVLVAKTQSLLKELQTFLTDTYPGITVHVFACDISDSNAVKDLFNQLRKLKLNLHVLVNNAGIMVDAVLTMATPEMIQEVIQVNVMGSIYVAQQASKFMIKNRAGSIINLSSIIGTNGNKGQTIYSSAKAAIIGFTKSLSKELAVYNVRVNALAPGFIDTDMTKSMDPKFYERNIESIGMKRIGKPEDIANVALFLASDLSAYVTAQIIGVDGGMLI